MNTFQKNADAASKWCMSMVVELKRVRSFVRLVGRLVGSLAIGVGGGGVKKIFKFLLQQRL